MPTNLRKNWENKLAEKLVGRTVKEVRYMTEEHSAKMCWNSSAIMIIFDDDSFICPMRDDEANDAGALFTSWNGLEIIPVI